MMAVIGATGQQGGATVEALLRAVAWSSGVEVAELAASMAPANVTVEIEGEAGFRLRESKMLAELVQHQNLVLATGHGMMGLSLGPVTGRLMAEILSGEKPAWDITMLSPERYN